MNNLSINLKALLDKATISENELARRTGIAQQIINRILSGENQNPKIATLSPLASYFKISISQLIGEELVILEEKPKQYWQEISLIDWDDLKKYSIDEIMLLQKKQLFIDIENTKDIFAIKMKGSSMEPKFSEGSLLIFDSKKKPVNGDFILMKLSDNDIVVNQFFTKNNMNYKKCLNPRYKDYKMTLISKNSIYLGTLIQSRTDYFSQ